eukprot:gene2740-12612_t
MYLGYRQMKVRRLLAAQELIRSVLKRHVIREWRGQATRLMHKRRMWEMTVELYSRKIMRRCLSGWQEAMLLHQLKAAMHEQASTHLSKALQMKALAAWNMYISVRISVHISTHQLTLHIYSAHLTKALPMKALAAWNIYIRRKRLSRDVVTWRREGLMRSVLGAWCGHTQYKASREGQRRAAVRHRYLRLLSRGLIALKAAVQRRHRKLLLWQQLDHHYLAHLLHSVLLAWAREFLPQAVEERARLTLVKQHWKGTLMRRAVQGWQEQSARLAIKHAVLGAALALAQYHRISSAFTRWLLGLAIKHAVLRAALALAQYHRISSAFTRWLLGLEVQKTNRISKAQTMLQHQHTLARHKLYRLFMCWLDVHSDAIMRHYQEARANGAWRDRTERRALHAWTGWIHKRRNKRRLLDRARARFQQHTQHIVVQAWQEFVRMNRRKSEATHVALEHAHKNLTLAALAAFRQYVSRRQKKRQDMAGAFDMYRLRLQKEGATHWLQVGLTRRQQRLSYIANEKREGAILSSSKLAPPVASNDSATLRMKSEKGQYTGSKFASPVATNDSATLQMRRY